MAQTIKFTRYIEDDEGGGVGEEEAELRALWVVCHRCGGNGTHLMAGYEGVAFTEEDVSQWSHEETEEYWGGGYDVQCGTCKGRTTVLEVDEDHYESIRRGHPDDAEVAVFDEYIDQLRDEADYQAECEMERKMGC